MTAGFRFHGRGCYFDLGETQIDIEFCGATDVIAFDSWRLYRFAQETLGDAEVEQEDIEAQLHQMTERGVLGFSREAPYFGLFFEQVRGEGGLSQ